MKTERPSETKWDPRAQTEEYCQEKSESDFELEMGTKLWKKAFFQAMYETHVEVLKAKINRSWGPKMDKIADLVLETMQSQWGTMLARAKAEIDLKERLSKAMRE